MFISIKIQKKKESFSLSFIGSQTMNKILSTTLRLKEIYEEVGKFTNYRKDSSEQFGEGKV